MLLPLTWEENFTCGMFSWMLTYFQANHRPAAYYDVLAYIGNILGVNEFWKWSKYEIFMVLRVASHGDCK